MLPPGSILAFGLYLARTSALVLSAPPFGTSHGFAASKIALTVILAMVLYAAQGQPLADSIGPIEFGALALREVLIGLALGLVAQLALMAVRIAGELIGVDMGLSLAGVADPVTGVSTPLVAQIYETLFLLGLLAIDGHHVLIRALLDSFERAPVGVITLGSSISGSVLALFAELFRAGLVFAAPVLVFLALASLLIGLIGRAVPQVHVMELGFSLRVMGALLALVLFAPLMAPAMARLYRHLQAGTEAVLEALPG
jgi:flagellar biosynthetic protein FliR